MSNNDIEIDEAIPIRKLQPGEVLSVVQKLRGFLTTLDSTSFTLYASFSDVGGSATVEAEARSARRTLELAALRISTLLLTLEQTPAYKEAVDRRKRAKEAEAASQATDEDSFIDWLPEEYGD